MTFCGEGSYVKRCFREYGLVTDDTGRYTAMYKPYHLIGLELAISVASVGLRREATGVATDWRADVIATAKRDPREGEMLDGEGGYTVWGKLAPAADSLALHGLPLGLAHGVRLKRAIVSGASLRWDDVEYDDTSLAVRCRLEMERELGNAFP